MAATPATAIAPATIWNKWNNQIDKNILMTKEYWNETEKAFSAWPWYFFNYEALQNT